MKNAVRYFQFGAGLSLVMASIFWAFGERAAVSLEAGGRDSGRRVSGEGHPALSRAAGLGSRSVIRSQGAAAAEAAHGPEVAAPSAFRSAVLAAGGGHALPRTAADDSPSGADPQVPRRASASAVGKGGGTGLGLVVPADVQRVDGLAAGNFLTLHGQRVEIERIVPSAENGGAELEAVVTPETSSSRSEDSGEPSAGRAESAVSILRRARAGFSQEEQLFRAKWGWTPYDHAGRSAFAASPGAVDAPVSESAD